jgi:hypothetical protein
MAPPPPAQRGSQVPEISNAPPPAQEGTNVAKRPSDVLVWLYFASLLISLFLPLGYPQRIIAIVAFFLICFDVDRLLKKNGYVDREQLLAKKGYKNIPLRLWAVFLHPVYLFKRARILGQKQLHLIVWCISFVICGIVVLVESSHDDHAVQAVRGGALEAYPDMTLGKALESFMSGAKWESLVADDGKTYVNVKGRVEFQGKPVSASIQYRLDEDDSFEIQAFEMNGVPQPMIYYLGLIEKAYEEAQKGHAQKFAPLKEPVKIDSKTTDIEPENTTPMDVGDVLIEYRADAAKAQAKFGGKRFRFAGRAIFQEPLSNGKIKVRVIDQSEIPDSEILLGLFVTSFNASEKKALEEGQGSAERQHREFNIIFDGTVVGKIKNEAEEEDEDVEFLMLEIASCKFVSELKNSK